MLQKISACLNTLKCRSCVRWSNWWIILPDLIFSTSYYFNKEMKFETFNWVLVLSRPSSHSETQFGVCIINIKATGTEMDSVCSKYMQLLTLNQTRLFVESCVLFPRPPPPTMGVNDKRSEVSERGRGLDRIKRPIHVSAGASSLPSDILWPRSSGSHDRTKTHL